MNHTDPIMTFLMYCKYSYDVPTYHATDAALSSVSAVPIPTAGIPSEYTTVATLAHFNSDQLLYMNIIKEFIQHIIHSKTINYPMDLHNIKYLSKL